MAESGQWVGGFRLVRELGVGGFGTVHLGENPSGERAAVKLLHPHLAKDAKVRRYFSQELVNARRVQGFCLAAIVDADAAADRPWIATEYVEGPTLGQAVRDRGPFSGGDLQRLAVQTITALNAIHAAGVVHRDLKPENILLGPDGPRVIDFGIARALDVDTGSATRIGTLGYMAPEQIEGTSLGPAVDLFAWGAVMIYAATGAPAFPGPTQAARINRVLNRPPESGELADPLLSIVLACTAKDPTQRPTARRVWDMLLTGRVTGSVSRTAPLDEEEAALLRAAGDGDPEAMAELGTLLFERGEVAEAEQWWRRGTEAESLAAMNSLADLLLARGEVGEAEQWWRRAAEAGDTEAMEALQGLQLVRGEAGEAGQWSRRAAEAGNAGVLNDFGFWLLLRGEVGEAEQWLRRAAEAGNAEAMGSLEGLLLARSAAAEMVEHVLSLSRGAAAGDTAAMNELGVLSFLRGDVDEGEQWWRRGAEAGDAEATKCLGGLLFARGEAGEGERWWRRAAEAGDVGAMQSLGHLKLVRGEAGEGEQWFLRAAEAGDTEAMNALKDLLLARGEVNEAEQWRRRAREAEADSAP